MHVYQLRTRCQTTGNLIQWFTLREDPPGPPTTRFSDLIISEICDGPDLDNATKFLSQHMTLSEVAALKSFLKRHTSFSAHELAETSCPLTESPDGKLWEDLNHFGAIHLDDHPHYDLPWIVRGRLIVEQMGDAQ